MTVTVWILLKQTKQKKGKTPIRTVCAGKGCRHIHSPAFPLAGGQYLTVSAAKGPGGKAARLVLPLGHLMHSGDLCLSFRHKVTGLHSSTLQVFLRKHGAQGAALWGRNGGHGWRQTQITLRGADIKSVSRTTKDADLGGFLSQENSGAWMEEDVVSSLTEDSTRFAFFSGHDNAIPCLFL